MFIGSMMINNRLLPLVRTGLLSMILVMGLTWAVRFLSISADGVLMCLIIVLLSASIVLQLWLKKRPEWLLLMIEAVALLVMLLFTFEMLLPFKYSLF